MFIPLLLMVLTLGAGIVKDKMDSPEEVSKRNENVEKESYPFWVQIVRTICVSH